MVVTDVVAGERAFEHVSGVHDRPDDEPGSAVDVESDGDPGGGYDAVVERAMASAGVNTSTPLDGGWGADMSDDARVGVSYTGEVAVPPTYVPEDFKGFPTLP